MKEYFWDTQINYLQETREQMWNDDYFEFLVKSVWKINKPVNIVDFGCGYGYLGIKLLPLLPEGSTYVGLDMGEELLNKGKEIFSSSPYQTDFIHVDLTKFNPKKQYDIAICQAVLRHIPSSKLILQKMIDSVLVNGMVICVEVNREMEEAGFYTNAIHPDDNLSASLRQKWMDELQSGGRDYKLGIKIPIYMQQLGLENVGVRINDFVEFTSPLSGEKEHDGHVGSTLRLKGYTNTNGIDINNTYILNARCLVISYGTKSNE